MRLSLAALLALSLAACGGTSQTNSGIGGSDAGRTGGLVDAGSDAGTDGGTDGGADGGADAGCLGSPNITAAKDACNFPSPGQTRSALAFEPSQCQVSLTLDTAIACVGTLSGASNAFSGVCDVPTGTVPCVSAALPGRVTCTLDGGLSPCNIDFCSNLNPGSNCL